MYRGAGPTRPECARIDRHPTDRRHGYDASFRTAQVAATTSEAWIMFNEKVDIKLIQLVKDNPVLYDFNNAKYMDFNAREVAWQRIGDELKRPAADCKVRWINIRDVNRRIIRKSLQNPGPHNRLYKYESQLSFMRPFYRDILIQNTEFESDDKSDKDWNTEECDQQMNCSNESDDSDYSIKKTKNKVSKGSKKKKKRSYEQEEKPATSNFSETTMASDFDPSDPVDAFLLSIGATLKTFSPYHLNLAKSKIFTVVQEHDLQQIVQKSNDVKVSTSDTMYLP
ncbi:uncharacterized protein LOC113520207 [Galleria mellonella]|uniref:Uncharacterized protein LOC113520207 n=1 Tax=Galleria mellonella TaxID=7137 RepID=A0A6J1WY58_GALME|nr:uncharacterized protein LOC113520207 [Galleria mellonella]